MRNVIDAYAKAVGSWAQNVSFNALTRTVNALDLMRQGQYDTQHLTKDTYEYLRDLADFRAQASLGLIPTASLNISTWNGSSASNFVQIPAASLALLYLTPVVNAETTTRLLGLELDGNQGENAARVLWVSANAGAALTAAADKNGLFQGAIYRSDNGELIATVSVITRLP